jgi:(1->4)-alpha-D-glucan 1-alpha-D-glucosylmutase
MPAAWRLLVRRWSRMNRSRKHEVDGDAAPSRNDEYLLYQTLAGSFPPGDPDRAAIDRYSERIQQYMVKAAREAKLRTSWLAINKPYEDALTGFVADLMRTDADNRFLDDLREHAATFAWFGMLNSLSMALLKLASPGVPDIYQGNEILDWSLVDPDNRRPVDYEARRALLASLAEDSGAHRGRSLFESPYDGRAKLWVTAQALGLRRQHPELFAAGEYRRVAVKGARENHIVAFRRISPKRRPEGGQAPMRSGAEGSAKSAEDGVLVVAGRFFASLDAPMGRLPVGELWADTKVDVSFVPRGTPVENVLTGETLVVDGDTLDVAMLFREFPGALARFANGGAGEASRRSTPGH